MNRPSIFSICFASLSLTACMASQPVPISPVYEGNVCNLGAAGIYRWSDVENNFTQYRDLDLPTLDDGAQRIVVSMGQFRTGGYSLNLVREELEISADTAIIPVELSEPNAGDMTAQMLTDPCLVIDVYSDQPLDFKLPEEQ